MEDSRKREYISERFPPGSTRSTSGVIYAAFGKKSGERSDKTFGSGRGFQIPRWQFNPWEVQKGRVCRGVSGDTDGCA